MSAVSRLVIGSVVVASAFLAPSPSTAQQPTQTVTDEIAGTQLGESLAVVGDLDGDGWTEIAVGAPRSEVDEAHTGSVRIYSTKSLALLRSMTGPVADSKCWFGVSLASGSSDGRSLLLVGASQGGRNDEPGYVALFDLKSDDAPVVVAGGDSMRMSIGWSLGVVKARELAPVEAWVVHGFDISGAGAVCQLAPDLSKVLSRVSRSGLTDGTFGLALDGAGDVDANGTPDVLIGDSSGAVFSCARGSDVVVERVGGKEDNDVEEHVAYLGDIDGDSADDFVVTCRQLFPDAHGPIAIVSGRTGAELRRIVVSQDEELGWSSLVRAGDLDGDGCDDFVADAYRNSDATCFVKAFSSRTGTLLFEAGSTMAHRPEAELTTGDDRWCRLAVVRTPAGHSAIVRATYGGHGRIELIPLPDAP